MLQRRSSSEQRSRRRAKREKETARREDKRHLQAQNAQPNPRNMMVWTTQCRLSCDSARPTAQRRLRPKLLLPRRPRWNNSHRAPPPPLLLLPLLRQMPQHVQRLQLPLLVRQYHASLVSFGSCLGERYRCALSPALWSARSESTYHCPFLCFNCVIASVQVREGVCE